MAARRLSLIFDADDTLWDSNVHFLQAHRRFASAVTSRVQLDPEAIGTSLSAAEQRVIKLWGYGRQPFVTALKWAAAELVPSGHLGPLLSEVEEIGAELLGQVCRPLPGVESTLRELATRHRLLLLTKGQPEEQRGKLDGSGLADLFSRVDVVREKDAQAYRRLAVEAELDPQTTHMIGNSPRSDINPALQAGLRAVYIPYPHTWEFEHDDLPRENERLVEVGSFPELLKLF
jgi:putative hydrolase of the HAD superfamily